jgi:hypothetical protein
MAEALKKSAIDQGEVEKAEEVITYGKGTDFVQMRDFVKYPTSVKSRE